VMMCVTSRNADRDFMARGSLSATGNFDRLEPYAGAGADVPRLRQRIDATAVRGTRIFCARGLRRRARRSWP
jgi:hypothetical protein